MRARFILSVLVLSTAVQSFPAEPLPSAFQEGLSDLKAAMQVGRFDSNQACELIRFEIREELYHQFYRCEGLEVGHHPGYDRTVLERVQAAILAAEKRVRSEWTPEWLTPEFLQRQMFGYLLMDWEKISEELASSFGWVRSKLPRPFHPEENQNTRTHILNLLRDASCGDVIMLPPQDLN